VFLLDGEEVCERLTRRGTQGIATCSSDGLYATMREYQELIMYDSEAIKYKIFVRGLGIPPRQPKRGLARYVVMSCNHK
jgi:hypothetical protein